MHSASQPIYRTIDQIEQIVQAFETCTCPPGQFNHHAHITVALWYLTKMPFSEATDKMRSTIQQFARSHHHSHLYNETITMFWLKLLRHLLDVTEPNASLPDVTYQTITSLGSMRFVFSHYSKELVFSDRARKHWVEPDLLPLPFGETIS